MYVKLSLIIFLSVKQVCTEKCTTPTGETGDCIPLSSCPSLLRAFANPVKGTEAFLVKFKCHNGVCCSSPNSRLHQNQLFNKQYCGYQHHIEGYRHKTNDVDKFPWLATIRAKSSTSEDEVLCGGSLINARYVLTAANCVNVEQKSGYKLLGVRLGDFSAGHKLNPGNETRQKRRELKHFEDFEIEEVIAHPFYDEKTMLNDIALLRLNKTIFYSDSIRPICLPAFEDGVSKPGDTFYMTGFDRSAPEDRRKTGKMITTTLMSNKECKQKFQSNHINTPLTMYHMCTSDSAINTGLQCQRDYGGPVMLFHDRQWYVEGILSYDTHLCREDSMKVQTKVLYYMNWIEENMRTW